MVLEGTAGDGRPSVHPETVQEWHDWLAVHHARGSGVWLVQWKRHTGRPAMSYEDAVTEALAWGWVDRAPIVLPGSDDELAAYPNLKRWFKAIDARPAVARARTSLRRRARRSRKFRERRVPNVRRVNRELRGYFSSATIVLIRAVAPPESSVSIM